MDKLYKYTQIDGEEIQSWLPEISKNHIACQCTAPEGMEQPIPNPILSAPKTDLAVAAAPELATPASVKLAPASSEFKEAGLNSKDPEIDINPNINPNPNHNTKIPKTANSIEIKAHLNRTDHAMKLVPPKRRSTKYCQS